MGAISLNLPLIYAKALEDKEDFFEVLDSYLEKIRELHLRTIEYLGDLRASINPLAFCEGGFYGGHLKHTDKIKPLLKSATASFGFTALNELQELYNQKSLVEDGEFAVKVMQHINDKVNEFKKEDHVLYAIYGAPAESLCLSGDTEVQTYNGYTPIKDIKVGDLVYTYNEEKKKIELKEVLASFMTSPAAKVVKIKTTNGQVFTCTANHPFAVRKMKMKPEGSFEKEYVDYVPAAELKPGMRLKSNYVQIHNGRPEFTTNQLIQDVNAEFAYGPKPKGYVTHHKDGDKTNNRFENLEYMSDHDHRVEHMDLTIGKYCYKSEDVMGENNPFYGKHHSAESKLLNRQAHLGKGVVACDEEGNIILQYECATDTERDGFNSSGVRHAVKKSKTHYYRGMYWYYVDELPENHVVESVEFPEEEIPVYNITVEDNHNYFVGGADGVLVHNCGLQVKQFRAKYGIIKGVSDRDYVSNSFHCHVTEDITGIQKQDLENRFWNLANGGKIQYVRYPVDYNFEACKSYVRRAMKLGFYEGINLSLAYCDDCGHSELGMDKCTKCGSTNLTKIDRMNGYLSYSRVKGDTRLNDAKMAEIADRKSM